MIDHSTRTPLFQGWRAATPNAPNDVANTDTDVIVAASADITHIAVAAFVAAQRVEFAIDSLFFQ
jgi:hypothetical protein